MRIIAIVLTAAFSCAAVSGAAWAHHGWAPYDASKQRKFTGTIADLKWEMPHVLLGVSSGGQRYEFQLTYPARMIDRGLVQASLTAGKTVTVEAQPNKEKANDWQAVTVTVDGYEYSMLR